MLSRYTSETWQLIGDKMQALSVYKFMHAGTCALKRAHTHTHARACSGSSQCCDRAFSAKRCDEYVELEFVRGFWVSLRFSSKHVHTSEEHHHTRIDVSNP